MGVRSHQGEINYGIKEYIFDTEEEFEEYKKENNIETQGSTAIIIEPFTLYIANSKSEWKKI